MDQVKIGKFISECRKKKKLTQEELAEKLGVTNKSVSRWENGKTMPDYSVINLLCNELDISINELLSGEKIKESNYENKANENLDSILKEYYKMKKQKRIIKIGLLIVSLLLLISIIKIILVMGIVSLSMLIPSKEITGIDNYDKSYYIEKYGGDLDSNLSIFPDNKDNLIDAEFSSSLQTNLFDSDGYILLKTKYNKNDFDSEIERIENLSATIYENCKSNAASYTNYVKYDDKSYDYPAYITIDGFGHTYEYALIDGDNFEITYVYLSYPKIDDSNYMEYLKKDKSIYKESNTMNKYSMYNHSFDGGKVYMEIGDCGK